MCIFLVPPQAGHLLRFVTSLSALPAICLCLFFMCEVFDLGTALRMPSQMSPRIDGIVCIAEGIVIASAGIKGSRLGSDVLVDRAVRRGELNVAEPVSRAKMLAKADDARRDCVAAILRIFGPQGRRDR